ncbi:MAG: hypothetical protein ACJ8OJ_01295 [Povalibacter sp.]|jgi:hypothetical protein
MKAPTRRRYLKKPSQYVTAVKLDLQTEGLIYRKWGGEQRAKRGDWLVDNDGDVYTVDARSFARTYKRLKPGVYLKTAPVWAEVAAADGTVETKEGKSRYRRGDYIVYNQKNGGDGYCVKASKFKAMYRLAE